MSFADLLREFNEPPPEPKLCFNPDCRHPVDQHEPEWGCHHSYKVGEGDTPTTPTGTGIYAAVCDCPELEYPPDDAA